MRSACYRASLRSACYRASLRSACYRATSAEDVPQTMSIAEEVEVFVRRLAVVAGGDSPHLLQAVHTAALLVVSTVSAAIATDQ